MDADYGTFRNEADNFQPNIYYDGAEQTIISQNITSYNTPVKIDIATAKASSLCKYHYIITYDC